MRYDLAVFPCLSFVVTKIEAVLSTEKEQTLLVFVIWNKYDGMKF